MSGTLHEITDKVKSVSAERVPIGRRGVPAVRQRWFWYRERAALGAKAQTATMGRHAGAGDPREDELRRTVVGRALPR